MQIGEKIRFNLRNMGVYFAIIFRVNDISRTNHTILTSSDLHTHQRAKDMLPLLLSQFALLQLAVNRDL